MGHPRQVGFPRRDERKLRVALQHTYALVWVRSTKKSRFARLGQVLGFARATSDGVFCAVIWDVAVSVHTQTSRPSPLRKRFSGWLSEGRLAHAASGQPVSLSRKLTRCSALSMSTRSGPCLPTTVLWTLVGSECTYAEQTPQRAPAGEIARVTRWTAGGFYIGASARV
jgi:hypothetical protein